jgi:MYXO-CTERM domain-containing protein
MIRKVAVVSVLSVGWMLAAGHAQAHIKLLKPASWIQENATGDPQKSGPCGPAAGQGTETNAVTTFTAGEEITVEWTETVNHEGHFRIALAKDRSELKDPVITGACLSAEISNPPQYPVLADGLFAVKTDDGQRMFSQKVKLPADMTCDNCTLQVMQFMTPHPTPCLYYHCANIRIVAPGAAGSGGTNAAPIAPSGGAGGARPNGGAGGGAVAGGGGAVAGRTGGAGGASAGQGATAGTGTSGASPSSSGCAVAGTGREHNGALAWLLVLGLVLARKRRRA